MFLHLGSDYVIPLKNVISITDMKAVKSGINQEFIKNKRSEKVIVDISDGSPKSFIVTDKKIYLSAISALTLKKRAGHVPEPEEE